MPVSNWSTIPDENGTSDPHIRLVHDGITDFSPFDTVDGIRTIMADIAAFAAGGSGADLGTAAFENFESGVWTPTVRGQTTAGTFTYTLRQGGYIRLQDITWVSFAIEVATVSSAPSGNALISGIPFSVEAASQDRHFGGSFGLVTGAANVPASWSGWMLSTRSGNPHLRISFWDNSNGSSSVADSNIFAASTRLRGSIAYRTDVA